MISLLVSHSIVCVWSDVDIVLLANHGFIFCTYCPSGCWIGMLTLFRALLNAHMYSQLLIHRIVIIIYRVYFHPLAKFPGPWYYAASRLPHLVTEILSRPVEAVPHHS